MVVDAEKSSSEALRLAREANENARDAANNQIGLMQGQLNEIKAEQRAWIGAPTITIESLVGGGYEFKGSVENVGHSPTRGLFIDAEIISGTDYNWETVANSLCKKRGEQSEDALTRFSLVPNDHWTFNFRQVPSWEDKDEPTSIDAIKHRSDPSIAGCILYGTRSDETGHQIIFLGIIDVKNNAPRVRSVYTARAN
jgi:hypothetical protein